MTAPYENAEFIELGTIMPPEKFRTVLPEDRDAPGGLTEQKVVIEFRRDSPIYSQLLPCFRGAMFVYGFLRRGKGLRALFGDKYDEIKESSRYPCTNGRISSCSTSMSMIPIQSLIL